MRLLIGGLVSGLLLGGLYAVAALGLSVVYGVMGVVNLAHGEIMILSAYATFVLVEATGLDPLVALAVIVPLIALFGFALQATFLNRLLRRRSFEAALVTTLGLSLMLQALLLKGFSSSARTFTPDYVSGGMSLFGVTVPSTYVLCLGTALAATLGMQLLMQRTSFGRQARAAAEDAETARLMGIHVERVYGTMFALSAGLSAIAGVLVGITFSFTPTTGVVYLLKAFTVVVLGGIGSFRGALIGGLVLGAVEGLGATIFGGGYRDLVGYVVFLTILVAAPNGLFARKPAT